MKSMEFEIIINADYLNLFKDTPLAPVENKTVLSLANDFEDEKWRIEKFENFIWDNIALTALSAKERETLAANQEKLKTLEEALKRLG